MKRLETYRQRRNLMQKYVVAALLFLFILMSGLLVADCSLNELISGEKEVFVISFVCSANSLEIDLLGRKITINTQYVNRDYNELKHKLGFRN